MNTTPELELPPAQANTLASLRAEMGDLEIIEADVLGARTVRKRLESDLEAFREEALSLWNCHDHFVLRRVPVAEDGATGLLIASALFHALRPYRAGRLVKSFHMTPWTTSLSHTLAEGSFHTDLNTAEQPPAATLMQCVHPDPDAPTYGQLRVARFRDVLDALLRSDRGNALRLLTEDEVVMVNDASPVHWSGRIHDGKTVRFHPETLRAGQRRLGGSSSELDDTLRVIHDAALSVSCPIDLGPGDILFVSNRRALHQRGACTVRFRSFPRDFESRSVAVMHAMDDLG
jgi:alpha-ketoglutarate-dependent taurine dioxygenase